MNGYILPWALKPIFPLRCLHRMTLPIVCCRQDTFLCDPPCKQRAASLIVVVVLSKVNQAIYFKTLTTGIEKGNISHEQVPSPKTEQQTATCTSCCRFAVNQQPRARRSRTWFELALAKKDASILFDLWMQSVPARGAVAGHCHELSKANLLANCIDLTVLPFQPLSMW